MATARPKSQEIVLSYKPQPKQALFHECEADEIFYGGAAGGGKSFALFWDAVNTCIQIPDFVGAIFRKTFPELESTHIRKAKGLSKTLGTYNATLREFHFINGAILEFNYCEHEDDVYRYMSMEWDGLYLDEGTHFTEFQYLMLVGRVRTSKSNVRTKVKTASNPGNVGHTFFKKRFISSDEQPGPPEPFKVWVPPRSAREIELKIPPRTRCFIPAKLDDNQAQVKADPSYRINLINLPSDQRRMLLDGDWDVHEGQFFSEWRRDKHVVEPFQIPSWWTRFGAYDHGYSHNAVFGWFATDEDGTTYLYRELVKNHTNVPELAAMIKQFEDTKKLSYQIGPQDLWLPPRDGIGPSVAEQFANNGLAFTPAAMNRIQGWTLVHNMLAWLKEVPDEENPGKTKTVETAPRFKVFSTCIRTIACVPTLMHDSHKQEDVLKVNCNEKGEGGDDPADMLRYGLMSRLVPSDPLEEDDGRHWLFRRRRAKTVLTAQDRWNHD